MPTLFDLSLALALAMDAFAVAIVIGTQLPREHHAYALEPALVFGAFQALMPVAGWALVRAFGLSLPPTLIAIVVCVILCGIGAKMIYEGVRASHDDPPRGLPTPLLLASMGLATSLDALAAGVGIGFEDKPIAITALWIGLITAALSLIGVLSGKSLAARVGHKPLVLGGLVLVALGIKALF